MGVKGGMVVFGISLNHKCSCVVGSVMITKKKCNEVLNLVKRNYRVAFFGD